MAHPPWDIIVLAVIALILGATLYRVLGRKIGAQGDRQENYRLMAHVEKMGRRKTASNTMQPPPLPGSVQAAEEQTEYVVPQADSPLGQKLLKVATLSSKFQGKAFLEQVEEMFQKIVQAFAHTDILLLEERLTPQVFTAFQKALRQREQDGDRLHVDVKRMERLEIADITFPEEQAASCQINVLITSWQVRYAKNSHGKMVGGTESLTEFRDMWGLALIDGHWRLAETAVA
ncbi:Tim44/TimA family putative adaptor protein [Saccharibacter floricola]|uniref:Tim44/TimA family putative adaptor protein n=1 Tax=Saccharibacter floricola TaxID=231053 RepID=UPI00038258E6|nr:Tim44/TimA family putative adaptor protein [Saccharibacter floricola]